MRFVIQRVTEASVTIDTILHSKIETGFLVLVGVEESDSKEDADWLCSKLVGLRIFSDSESKMNLSIKDIKGDILLVSQFTLFASTKKGSRPSFIKSAKPEIAIPLYEYCIQQLTLLLEKPIQTGVFGADMQVALINDGPVTILMDSKNKD
jgi:D-tyrosyl-tRNA(Tyr) deacylase